MILLYNILLGILIVGLFTKYPHQGIIIVSALILGSIAFMYHICKRK